MADTGNGSSAPLPAFRNDGSFLEQFMKSQHRQQSPEPAEEKKEASPVPSEPEGEAKEGSGKSAVEEKKTPAEPSDAKKPGPFSKFAKKAPFAGSVRLQHVGRVWGAFTGLAHTSRCYLQDSLTIALSTASVTDTSDLLSYCSFIPLCSLRIAPSLFCYIFILQRFIFLKVHPREFGWVPPYF